MERGPQSRRRLLQDDVSFKQPAIRDGELPTAGIGYANRAPHNHISSEPHVSFHHQLFAPDQRRRPAAEPGFQLVDVPVVTAIKLNDDLPVLSLRVLHHPRIFSQHIGV